MGLKLPRKYRNSPTTVGGVRFDSKREAARWLELVEAERRGEVTALRRQVRVPIVVNGCRVCVYVADFAYIRGGVRVLEDVKSWITKRDRVYRLKSKLVQAVYGLEILETE